MTAFYSVKSVKLFRNYIFSYPFSRNGSEKVAPTDGIDSSIVCEIGDEDWKMLDRKERGNANIYSFVMDDIYV